MLCFNTIVAILALIGTGLISAGIVMLLMSLGLPDKKEDDEDNVIINPYPYTDEEHAAYMKKLIRKNNDKRKFYF